MKRNFTVGSQAISRSLLLVLCLSQVMVLGYASGERKTFIVQVDEKSKPSVFPTHEQWYKSNVAAAVEAALKTESGTRMDAQPNDALLLHVYNKVLHGFSARLTKEEATRMAKTLDVLAVLPDRVRNLHTTRSPHFLGIDTPNGSSLLAELQRSGHGLRSQALERRTFVGLYELRRHFGRKHS